MDVGLDKSARLAAQAQKQDKAPPPLDPPFPFVAIPFDPKFFGLDRAQAPAPQPVDLANSD
jgi:hypothetical protein